MVNLLSHNILIYGSVNAIRAIAPFLLLPILTASFTQEEYGTLAIIEITILLIAPLILSSINGGINTEYFHLDKFDLKLYITNSIVLSFLFFIIVSTLFFLLGEELANLFHIPAALLYWLPFFALIRIPMSVFLGILQVRQEAMKYGVFSIAQALLDLFLSYVLVVMAQEGYLGRLGGVYITYALFSAISLFVLYRMDLFVFKVVYRYTHSILKFVLPLIPHAIAGAIIAYSDRYFVAYFAGNSEVGKYVVAYQVSSILALIAMSVNQAWTPILFKSLKNNDLIQYTIKIIIWIIFGYILIAFLLYLSESYLFNLLIDKKFHDAKQYFLYLLIGFFFQSVYMLFSSFFFFYKKTSILAILSFSLGIINIILNYILYYGYGTIGVAYATAITWFIFMSLTIYLSFRVIKSSKKLLS